MGKTSVGSSCSAINRSKSNGSFLIKSNVSLGMTDLGACTEKSAARCIRLAVSCRMSVSRQSKFCTHLTVVVTIKINGVGRLFKGPTDCANSFTARILLTLENSFEEPCERVIAPSDSFETYYVASTFFCVTFNRDYPFP